MIINHILKKEGVKLFYVNPKIQPQFNSLSPELRGVIQEKNVRLDNLNDLINVLENITKEAEE